mgnify:CR=1 FL=1
MTVTELLQRTPIEVGDKRLSLQTNGPQFCITVKCEADEGEYGIVSWYSDPEYFTNLADAIEELLK